MFRLLLKVRERELFKEVWQGMEWNGWVGLDICLCRCVCVRRRMINMVFFPYVHIAIQWVCELGFFTGQ